MEIAEAKTATAKNEVGVILIHLSTFAGYLIPFGNLLIPFVVYLVSKKPEQKELKSHSAQVFNFQIAITIVTTLGLIVLAGIGLLSGVINSGTQNTAGLIVTLGVGLLGLLAIAAVVIVNIVYSIINAVKASNREPTKYPIKIKLLKES
jgi:uncharacterized Tic20 family protein